MMCFSPNLVLVVGIPCLTAAIPPIDRMDFPPFRFFEKKAASERLGLSRLFLISYLIFHQRLKSLLSFTLLTSFIQSTDGAPEKERWNVF